MKKIFVAMAFVFFLSGCRSETNIERALALRQSLLASGCSFDARITADYGEDIYEFAMHCTADVNGEFLFIVTSPDTIKGITGTMSSASGKLTFDDLVLAFPILADGEVSPVSAPWLFWKTLQSGYISACGVDGDLLHLSVADSYEEEPLRLDIWLDDTNSPVCADILWHGRKVLSIRVENFCIL